MVYNVHAWVRSSRGGVAAGFAYALIAAVPPLAVLFPYLYALHFFRAALFNVETGLYAIRDGSRTVAVVRKAIIWKEMGVRIVEKGVRWLYNKSWLCFHNVDVDVVLLPLPLHIESSPRSPRSPPPPPPPHPQSHGRRGHNG